MKLKLLSFDAEVLPYGEQMPVPEECPILLISFAANYEIIKGKKKAVLVLNRDSNIGEGIEEKGDSAIIRFNDERRLIDAWGKVCRGADVLIGYNTNGFDFPYIIDRAKILKVGDIKIGASDDNLWHRKHVAKGMSVVTVGGVKGKIVFDVLYLLRRGDESNTIKKEYNLKNLTLEWTSKEVLGIEKLDFSAPEIIDYWNGKIDEGRFIEYCSRDSELALEFVTRFRLLDKFIMLSKRSGKLVQDIIDSQGFGGLVENLLMKEFSKVGRVVPMRRSSSGGEDSDELEGAFVLEPKLGITDNLGSCDYKSLYPTLMVKHNLCYTTVIAEKEQMIGLSENDYEAITSEDGICYGNFVKKEVLKGIVPTILEKLMKERQLLKIEMKKHEKGSSNYLMHDAGQNAAKILLNSFFGYSGEEGAKLYSWAVASSVTGSGRKQIKKTISMIKGINVTLGNRSYRFGIALSDTDSTYVQVIPIETTTTLNIPTVIPTISRDEVMGCINEIIGKVNATLEKPMELAPENYIKRLLVKAKKNYTMLIVDEKGKSYIVSKGIESIRRDWCDYSTDAMDRVIDIILNESDIGKGISESTKFIQDEANKLRKGEIDINRLVLSKKLSKPLTAYDGKSVHAMVAKRMLSRGKKVEIGDRVSYLIMNNGKRLISEKAEDVDWVKKERMLHKIDNEYYINHQLLPPVSRVLGVLGVKEIFADDKKQKSLMDY